MSKHVELQTNKGTLRLELDEAKAPASVRNFLEYVKAGHYNGTVFHRVIDNFMIQGGGMTADMKEKPTRAPIPLESRNGLDNLRGTLAMARTPDPKSAWRQPKRSPLSSWHCICSRWRSRRPGAPPTLPRCRVNSKRLSKK